MKTLFPQNGLYKQTNRSDVLGSLWSTFNIDLQKNVGVMMGGNKMKLAIDSGTLGTMGCPVAFANFDGLMWSVTGSTVSKTSANVITTNNWSADTSTGYQTTYSSDTSDMLVFNGELVVSGSSGGHIFSKASNGAGTGAWTDRGSVSGGSRSNKLLYFKKFDRLYTVTDSGTKIKSFDTSWSLSSSGNYTLTTLISGISGVISTIACTSDSIWIAVVRPTSGSYDSAIDKAVIYQWDGYSEQYTNKFDINAQGCVAITIINDRPYALDSNGVLLEYNGGFSEIDRLPLGRDVLTQAVGSSNDRFIHPNGMISTKNGTIKMLINNKLGDNAGSIKENLPSGIWEWSKETGLVHCSSLSYMPLFDTTITDFGQNRISRAGALYNANLYSTSSSGKSTLICGATYFNNASGTINGIFVDAPTPTDNSATPEGQKRGYMVSTWLNAVEIEDIFNSIYPLHKKFLNSTDKLIFKYRLDAEDPIETSITWVNTTSFTTTTDVSAYAPTATGFDGTYGGEVEITQGTGGGACVHITNVSENAGTYTVTVDNAVTGVTTGTAKARFQKWVKLLTDDGLEVTGQVLKYAMLPISKNSTRIQVKMVYEFTGDNEFHRFILTHTPLITAID